MLRLILALALFCGTGLAQVSRSVIHPKVYTYYKTTVLSGAVETVTLQQPASGAHRVLMKSATVCSDTATVWTLTMNGTAATGTAATELLLTDGGAPLAAIWHTSNVGTGSTIMAYPLAADECRTINLSKIHLIGSGTAKNVSIETDSITGTVHINLTWEERRR